MFCAKCRDVVAKGHKCPPPWRVRISAWDAETSVRAATAESAAVLGCEDLDDDGAAVDETVRVEVWPEGQPAAVETFRVRAQVSIDYSIAAEDESARESGVRDA